MFSQMAWDVRVTLDLFLGGLGVGVFLMSVLLSFYDRERYSKLIKVGSYIAPVVVGVGLLLLISELGRPERFLTMMYRFNPTSVLSWGGILQAAFVTLALVYAGMNFKNLQNSNLFRKIEIIAAILALAVGVYHGLLISSVGRPLWAGGMVPVMFLTSSLLGGVALVIFLKSFAFAATSSAAVRSEVAAASTDKGFSLNLLFAILTGFQLILVFIWQVTISRSTLEVNEVMKVLLDGYGAYWWGLVIVAGLIIPLIGAVYQLVQAKKQENSNGMAIVIALLVLIGSFAFKHIILTVGQIDIPIF